MNAFDEAYVQNYFDAVEQISEVVLRIINKFTSNTHNSSHEDAEEVLKMAFDLMSQQMEKITNKEHRRKFAEHAVAIVTSATPHHMLPECCFILETLVSEPVIKSNLLIVLASIGQHLQVKLQVMLEADVCCRIPSIFL
jgi:hypothetical protein